MVSQEKRVIGSTVVEETFQESLMPHCESDVASFTQSVGHTEIHLRSAVMEARTISPV